MAERYGSHLRAPTKRRRLVGCRPALTPLHADCHARVAGLNEPSKIAFAFDVDQDRRNSLMISGNISISGSFRPPAPVPSPKRLGLVSLLRTLMRNPIECWAEEHFRKASVTVRLPLLNAVLVHETRAIRRVLLENAENYRKDSLQRRVLSAGLGEGLLSAEGSKWQMQRRTLAPLFAPRTVLDFAPAVLKAVAALCERWRLECGERELDVAAEMTRLTLDVLERTIFSDGLGRDVDEIRSAMGVYFNSIGRISPLDLIGVPDFVPRIGHLRVSSTLRYFESAIDHIIETRRRRLEDGPNGGPEDILTLLLKALDPDTSTHMTAAEVRSNILTFVAAGHETTANALTWSLFLLSQSPEWRSRVEAEADNAICGPIDGMLDRLAVTRAVVEEALRLYPPIAAISRVAMDTDELAGEPVRRGSLIVIAPYILHRHRLLWNHPEDFDPARFLGSARKEIDRFAYLPFGAGPRTCIGATFAMQEATLALATIAHHFRLELAPRHAVWPVLRVTLRPAGGLPVIARPRSPRERTRDASRP
jgi:cytochrome P450